MATAQDFPETVAGSMNYHIILYLLTDNTAAHAIGIVQGADDFLLWVYGLLESRSRRSGSQAGSLRDAGASLLVPVISMMSHRPGTGHRVTG